MWQQIAFVGNVGKVEDLRYTPKGTAVLNFSVAVNKRTGTGEEAKDETTWFNCAAWSRLAETMWNNGDPMIVKGKQILVIGEVSADAYTDKSGQARATLVVNANTIKLLGKRGDVEHSDSHEPVAEPSGLDDLPF